MIPQSTSGLLGRHWLPRRPAIDIGRLRAWRNMCRASARPLSTQSYPSHRLHSGAADPCGPGGASWAARKLHIPSSPRWRFDLSCRPMLPSGSPINNTPMNGAVRHLSLCLSLRAAFVGRPALARSSRWPLTSDAQGRHRQQPSRWKRIPSPSIVRSKPLVPFPNLFTSSRACRFSSATPATAPIPQRASPRDPSPLPGRISRGEFFLPSRPPVPGRSSNNLGGAGNTGSLSRGSPPPPAPPPNIITPASSSSAIIEQKNAPVGVRHQWLRRLVPAASPLEGQGCCCGKGPEREEHVGWRRGDGQWREQHGLRREGPPGAESGCRFCSPGLTHHLVSNLFPFLCFYLAPRPLFSYTISVSYSLVLGARRAGPPQPLCLRPWDSTTFPFLPSFFFSLQIMH